MFHLVVKSPFGRYHVGHEITDPAEVFRILASHNESHVVKRAAPPAPAPAPEPAKVEIEAEPAAMKSIRG